MPTLSYSDVFTPATASQWLSTILQNAATVGLTTTAWQPGGITRSILSIVSNLLGLEDVMISLASQGGFLDFAASGTVSFVNPITGNSTTMFVTPDPSIPAQFPTPGVVPLPGWLDILADSVYNCQRFQPTFAQNTLYFANTSGAGSATYATGTYHVSNVASGATYSNQASLTIAASTMVAGPTGSIQVTNVTNASPIVITTSSAHGLTNGQVVYVTGVGGNTAANGFWTVAGATSTTFQLSGSTGNGTWIVATGQVWTTQSAQFQADVSGTGSNGSPNTITAPVTTLVGVFCSNLATFIAQNFESNTALAARCRLKQQSLSPNGAKAAYQYFALTAFQLLSGQVLGGVQQPLTTSLLTQAVTQALVTASTTSGTETTTLANATGALAGAVGVPITAATNASPINVTVSSATGLANGQNVLIAGVQGNTAANGYWTISGLSGATFNLNGSAGNGTYTSGGTLEAGDLGLVDSVIQGNVVPTGVTAATQSATGFAITIVTSVTVPAAIASSLGTTAIQATISNALTNWFATVPIGGFVSGVTTPNTVPYNSVLGVIENALGPLGSANAIRSATLTLNGGTSDVSLTTFQVPTITSPAPAVTVQTF